MREYDDLDLALWASLAALDESARVLAFAAQIRDRCGLEILQILGKDPNELRKSHDSR